MRDVLVDPLHVLAGGGPVGHPEKEEDLAPVAHRPRVGGLDKALVRLLHPLPEELREFVGGGVGRGIPAGPEILHELGDLLFGLLGLELLFFLGSDQTSHRAADPLFVGLAPLLLGLRHRCGKGGQQGGQQGNHRATLEHPASPREQVAHRIRRTCSRARSPRRLDSVSSGRPHYRRPDRQMPSRGGYWTRKGALPARTWRVTRSVTVTVSRYSPGFQPLRAKMKAWAGAELSDRATGFPRGTKSPSCRTETAYSMSRCSRPSRRIREGVIDLEVKAEIRLRPEDRLQLRQHPELPQDEPLRFLRHGALADLLREGRAGHAGAPPLRNREPPPGLRPCRSGRRCGPRSSPGTRRGASLRGPRRDGAPFPPRPGRGPSPSPPWRRRTGRRGTGRPPSPAVRRSPAVFWRRQPPSGRRWGSPG